ncbi:MAG TPA: flagellar hook-basal body complex protein [Steroidobacter sp.]
MIDSIFVALSGMRGHERALGVISNNVSNMNTPGFRGSSVNFTDVFFGSDVAGRAVGRQSSGGGGLDASRQFLNLRPSDASQTDRTLDVALEGDGFFVLQDENGETLYTRAGRFEVDNDELVALGTKRKVMSRDDNGQLVPMSIADLRVSVAKRTARVTMQGILSSGTTDGGSGGNGNHTINSLEVYDANGVKHTLRMEFRLNTDTPPAGALVDWNVTVFEDNLEIGTGLLEFIGPQPTLGSSPLTLTLALNGVDPVDIEFDFEGVQVQANTTPTMSVEQQDGYGTGTKTGESFDTEGVLRITYSNGQTVSGPKLILARIIDEGGLVEKGSALFAYRGSQPIDLREAGDDLKVRGGALELSNVDLTQQFSELILMQRGYQASSQVITTANDMLQELLQMRGGR